MILPDINLLIYAYNSDAPGHARAKVWWENCLSSPEEVALPWVVMLGFIRLMTSPNILQEPLAPAEAFGHVRSWLDRPQVQIVQPGPLNLKLMAGLAAEAGKAGPLTTDIHLAALAIEIRATVHTNDSDFARFSRLNHVNPLLDSH